MYKCFKAVVQFLFELIYDLDKPNQNESNSVTRKTKNKIAIIRLMIIFYLI